MDAKTQRYSDLLDNWHKTQSHPKSFVADSLGKRLIAALAAAEGL
jgi:hypothetical protein